MAAIAKESAFSEISDFAFITGLLSAIEVILSMPIEDIVKTMPLAEPIVKALVNHEGLLGELLVLTSNYIVGEGESMTLLTETYGIDSDFIHREFVEASRWCQELGIFS